jgi:cytochrome c5
MSWCRLKSADVFNIRILTSSKQRKTIQSTNLTGAFMKRSTFIFAALLGTIAANLAHAYEPDWKRGRIIYRSFCTSCHTTLPMGGVNPSTKTKADWTTYLQQDKHAKGKDTVSQYVSKEYRASIKATNKAAEKFAEVPAQDLMADMKAFLMQGAKDGDAPATCN